MQRLLALAVLTAANVALGEAGAAAPNAPATTVQAAVPAVTPAVDAAKATMPVKAAKKSTKTLSESQKAAAKSVAGRPDGWRYRWDGQMWWYYTPANRWSYWNGKIWQPIPRIPTANDQYAGIAMYEEDDAPESDELIPQQSIDPVTGAVAEQYRFQEGTDRIGENN